MSGAQECRKPPVGTSYGGGAAGALRSRRVPPRVYPYRPCPLNEKWHVHLNSPITVQENVERRSQAGDKPGRRLHRNSPCSPIPTTSPDDWLQPELRTEALIYTKHIPEASARSPGGPRAAASGACRADNSRAFESDADRLRQDSLMRCSVDLPPLLPCPLGIHPKLTYGPRSRNAPFVRSLRFAVPHLIASIMSDPKWPS
jgi:hypothetical protein